MFVVHIGPADLNCQASQNLFFKECAQAQFWCPISPRLPTLVFEVWVPPAAFEPSSLFRPRCLQFWGTSTSLPVAPCPPTPGPNKPLLRGYSTSHSPPHTRSPLTPCDGHDLPPQVCSRLCPLRLRRQGTLANLRNLATAPSSPFSCMSALQHAKAAKAQSSFPNSAATSSLRVSLRITPPPLPQGSFSSSSHP